MCLYDMRMLGCMSVFVLFTDFCSACTRVLTVNMEKDNNYRVYFEHEKRQQLQSVF